MAHEYQGWTLTEIKQMSSRERLYWMALANWRRDSART